MFEVPYELPFIAITEKAFTRLVNEQYEVLQRGIAIHKRLERLVLEERGLDEVVARAGRRDRRRGRCALGSRARRSRRRQFRRAAARGGARACGRPRCAARGVAAGQGPRRRREFAPDHPELAGRSLVLPVSPRGRGAPQAWLVAARDTGALGDFERLILQQAVTVVALELMRQRAMRDTERRLAGDVLAEALTGRPVRRRAGDAAAAVRRRAATPRCWCSRSDGSGAPEAEADLDRFLADAGVGALVASRGRLLCAVVDAADGFDPVGAGRTGARGAGARARAAARGRVARRRPSATLRRSFHEARCALEAAALANGSAPAGGVLPRPGAFQLLLSLQDDDALRLYCYGCPVRSRTRRGIRAQADPLARGVHRAERAVGAGGTRAVLPQAYAALPDPTIGAATGRDLSSARDRIEFWLALRARELVT